MAEAASLSKLDILIAQLESIAASASSQFPDPLICFDLLSDLLSSLDDHPKVKKTNTVFFFNYILDLNCNWKIGLD